MSPYRSYGQSSLNVGIGDHRGTYLLVTVGCKLTLERLRRIETGIHGDLHLQAIGYEERHVVGHALLVDDSLGVILVVGILKFRARHRMTVDMHDNWVILLRQYDDSCQ